ncbi:DEAD/DEAH box helicase [Pleionea litopenaei]|uniref:DEAD/DEAH box helicase n=1 Tax=Pleionea litopenaei TaxID=3070815 RepID=A0AA51X6P9_9GAMM|nr:DEAD/DEAH box helicase [Pleionea sp. HL-JVS1]WMS87353.1 DEAD/DEAH box helicase [Pleionea sp. HL-JVS1]
MSFKSFDLLPNILENLRVSGYQHPTDIQQEVIPAALTKRDIIAVAQTGTGKTAAFSLPLLQQLVEQREKGQTLRPNTARALVLAPTRELALQVDQSFKTYGAGLNLIIECVFGGVKINPQMMRLRSGCDVLVATPGRLLDLISKNAVRLEDVQTLVLDEADRMLDLGFAPEIDKLFNLLPKKRHTLLFSATMSDTIRELGTRITVDAKHISVNPKHVTVRSVTQTMHPVDKKEKADLLIHLFETNDWSKALIFVKTKKSANQLAKQLNLSGIPADCLHGDRSQRERQLALQKFKDDVVRVLVATDVAARGIDIEQMPLVINFDLPKVAEDYIHRIGRTGRAGQAGLAISLVSADEVDLLKKIETSINQLLKRELVRGFYPNHNVPETKLMSAKKKKPHKKKLAKLKLLQQESGREVKELAENQDELNEMENDSAQLQRFRSSSDQPMKESTGRPSINFKTAKSAKKNKSNKGKSKS